MSRRPYDVVREICLGLPETDEAIAHGMRNFRVRGKTFATYAVNHHGDGRVALWLPGTADARAALMEVAPEAYFVPPYVGPRGWLGVQIDGNLSWTAITARVREAYRFVAPVSLGDRLPAAVPVAPPTAGVDPLEFDPLSAPRARAVLAELRPLCLALPEVTEGEQFGRPAWRAGKKTFCTVSRAQGRTRINIWVGGAQQATLTVDPRYTIPAFIGRNGWISLDVEDHANREEIRARLVDSYRHFALKRMLRALDLDA